MRVILALAIVVAALTGHARAADGRDGLSLSWIESAVMATPSPALAPASQLAQRQPWCQGCFRRCGSSNYQCKRTCRTQQCYRSCDSIMNECVRQCNDECDR